MAMMQMENPDDDHLNHMFSISLPEDTAIPDAERIGNEERIDSPLPVLDYGSLMKFMKKPSIGPGGDEPAAYRQQSSVPPRLTRRMRRTLPFVVPVQSGQNNNGKPPRTRMPGAGE